MRFLNAARVADVAAAVNQNLQFDDMNQPVSYVASDRMTRLVEYDYLGRAVKIRFTQRAIGDINKKSASEGRWVQLEADYSVNPEHPNILLTGATHKALYSFVDGHYVKVAITEKYYSPDDDPDFWNNYYEFTYEVDDAIDGFGLYPDFAAEGTWLRFLRDLFGCSHPNKCGRNTGSAGACGDCCVTTRASESPYCPSSLTSACQAECAYVFPE